MNDSINGISRGNTPPTPPGGKVNNGALKGGAAGKSGVASAAQGAVNVNLTNAAESLQELEKTLATDASISSEKVEAIKSALNSGNYQIDPDRIAEKFLEVERALGKV